jgi:hypothetical protein
MGGDDDEVRKGVAGTFSRRKPLRETPLARCEEEKPSRSGQNLPGVRREKCEAVLR